MKIRYRKSKFGIWPECWFQINLKNKSKNIFLLFTRMKFYSLLCSSSILPPCPYNTCMVFVSETSGWFRNPLTIFSIPSGSKDDTLRKISYSPQIPLISLVSLKSLNSEIILLSLPVLHFTKMYACISTLYLFCNNNHKICKKTIIFLYRSYCDFIKQIFSSLDYPLVICIWFCCN